MRSFRDIEIERAAKQLLQRVYDLSMPHGDVPPSWFGIDPQALAEALELPTDAPAGDPPAAVTGRVRRLESQVSFLRLVLRCGDPMPCRNCGRVVLAGACCSNPSVPDPDPEIARLKTLLDDMAGRLLAADVEITKLTATADERLTDLEQSREMHAASIKDRLRLQDRIASLTGGLKIVERERDIAIGWTDEAREKVNEEPIDRHALWSRASIEVGK